MAVYSGNAPNTDGVTHNASCSDTNENVTVTSVGSSLTHSTELGASDLGRRSSAPAGGNLAGTVLIKLYALASTASAGRASPPLRGPDWYTKV